MVVFTCGHCGESVNKPKVEKHYLTKCRNRNPNLSCMDCFKDFIGNAYEEHNKCVTEEQRYAAKGFVAKEKKGELKQNAWVEMVQNVLDEQKDAPANVLRILNTVSKHNNTPRKKPKFVNFVKNVCGHKTNPKDIDSAWDMISVKLAALAVNQNRSQKQNEETSEANNEQSNTNNNDSSTNADESHVSSSSDTKVTNGDIETDMEKEKNGKKSKKQRKEEKKLKKYEAELESAGHIQSEEIEEEEDPKIKKGKKKNKGESTSDNNSANDTRNKKRKRQDTVNSTASNEATENDIAELQIKNLQLNGEKTKKKKPKVEEEPEESLCLHDQNVATSEDQVKPEKFNWHAVIMSVLQKKGNEVQFKRLQKKVLGEYAEVTGQDVDDRIADKFIKKLRSTPNVRVDKNRVVLVQ